MAFVNDWLADERTERRYSFDDGTSCVITNEFQKMECPECGSVEYVRLTHLWHSDASGIVTPEYHVNHGADLDALKALHVSYAEPAQMTPVKEVRVEGGWALVVGETQVATAE